MQSKQHLIAIDLDGTLLNTDYTISNENKRALQLAMEQGHIVVIATGRSFRMSSFIYNELNLNTPIINSNGALIHHPLNKEWGLYHTPLTNKIALDIIDLSYKANVKNIIAKVSNNIYLDKHDDRILQFFKPALNDYPFLIGNVREQLKHDPTIMMLYPEEKHASKLVEEISHLYPDDVQLRYWGPPLHVVEIMRKGLSKAEALKRIADFYKIPQQNIIAFGDESNDTAMIKYAGVGVAMGNAIDDLKNVADFITESNVNSGVATFLSNYLQLEKTMI